MFRRSFLQLPIFGFLGSKFKNNIESKQEDLGKWENPYCERFELEEESFEFVEKTVLNWLKNTKEPMVSIPVMHIDGFERLITFTRSIINLRKVQNTWDQWHIATSGYFPKIISTPIKTIGINNTKLIDNGFIMPNEVRSERYDGTSYI